MSLSFWIKGNPRKQISFIKSWKWLTLKNKQPIDESFLSRKFQNCKWSTEKLVKRYLVTLQYMAQLNCHHWVAHRQYHLFFTVLEAGKFKVTRQLYSTSGSCPCGEFECCFCCSLHVVKWALFANSAITH